MKSGPRERINSSRGDRVRSVLHSLKCCSVRLCIPMFVMLSKSSGRLYCKINLRLSFMVSFSSGLADGVTGLFALNVLLRLLKRFFCLRVRLLTCAAGMWVVKSEERVIVMQWMCIVARLICTALSSSGLCSFLTRFEMLVESRCAVLWTEVVY